MEDVKGMRLRIRTAMLPVWIMITHLIPKLPSRPHNILTDLYTVKRESDDDDKKMR